MIKKVVICPNCKGQLEVINKNELQVMQIKCPNPVCGAGLRIDFSDELNKTEFSEKADRSDKIGSLILGKDKYALMEGKNIIGRYSESSKATVQLKTSDKSMSREHTEIDVIRLQSGRIKAILRDIRDEEKMKKRPLLVEDEPLAVEDRISLCHGYMFTLGNTEVKYIQE